MIALAMLAAVAGFQDTAALDRAVAGFTGHAVGEEGGARAGIDPRLRIARCPMVALAWRSDAHDAVVVSCPDTTWRLFVPVRSTVQPATATASAPMPTRVVAAPVIKRGDPVVIEAGDQGFSISREGVAMADAATGARFLVRVEDAKAPVQAIAIAGGRAALPGWND